MHNRDIFFKKIPVEKKRKNYLFLSSTVVVRRERILQTGLITKNSMVISSDVKFLYECNASVYSCISLICRKFSIVNLKCPWAADFCFILEAPASLPKEFIERIVVAVENIRDKSGIFRERYKEVAQLVLFFTKIQPSLLFSSSSLRFIFGKIWHISCLCPK